MDIKQLNKIEKNIKLSLDAVVLFEGNISILFTNITRTFIARDTGAMLMQVLNDVKIDLGFFKRLKFSSYYNYNSEKKWLYIDLYNLMGQPDAQIYYEFLDILLKNPLLKAEIVAAATYQHIFKNWDDKINESWYPTHCCYCNASFEYQMYTDPIVIACPACQKKIMEVFCMKCGWGGVVYNSPDSDLGEIADIETYPEFWKCRSCKNQWRLNKEVYTHITPVRLKTDSIIDSIIY